jgi:hypothetical protein
MIIKFKKDVIATIRKRSFYDAKYIPATYIEHLPLLAGFEYKIKQITFYKVRLPIIYVIYNKRQYKLDLKTVGIDNYSLKFNENI